MQQSKTTTRKRAPSQSAIKKNISQGLINHIERLAKQVAKGNRNEEETRRWIIDVLRSAFGYKDDQLETEMKVLGKRVDIAVKSGDKVLMVIECKASNVKLNKAAVNQATSYAIALGAEWALVTNGQVWDMYHVSPNKGAEPDISDVFIVEILDDDGISKSDIDCLYLLTEKALSSGETLKTMHWMKASSIENILNTIFTDKMLKAISSHATSNYKKEYGVEVEGVTPDLIQEMLCIYFDVEIKEVKVN